MYLQARPSKWWYMWLWPNFAKNWSVIQTKEVRTDRIAVPNHLQTGVSNRLRLGLHWGFFAVTFLGPFSRIFNCFGGTAEMFLIFFASFHHHRNLLYRLWFESIWTRTGFRNGKFAWNHGFVLLWFVPNWLNALRLFGEFWQWLSVGKAGDKQYNGNGKTTLYC